METTKTKTKNPSEDHRCETSVHPTSSSDESASIEQYSDAAIVLGIEGKTNTSSQEESLLKRPTPSTSVQLEDAVVKLDKLNVKPKKTFWGPEETSLQS